MDVQSDVARPQGRRRGRAERSGPRFRCLWKGLGGDSGEECHGLSGSCLGGLTRRTPWLAAPAARLSSSVSKHIVKASCRGLILPLRPNQPCHARLRWSPFFLTALASCSSRPFLFCDDPRGRPRSHLLPGPCQRVQFLLAGASLLCRERHQSHRVRARGARWLRFMRTTVELTGLLTVRHDKTRSQRRPFCSRLMDLLRVNFGQKTSLSNAVLSRL